MQTCTEDVDVVPFEPHQQLPVKGLSTRMEAVSQKYKIYESKRIKYFLWK